jgi:hypothetical protein
MPVRELQSDPDPDFLIVLGSAGDSRECGVLLGYGMSVPIIVILGLSIRSNSTTMTGERGEVSKFDKTGERLVGLLISTRLEDMMTLLSSGLISRSVVLVFFIILMIFKLEHVQSSSYSPT